MIPGLTSTHPQVDPSVLAGYVPYLVEDHQRQGGGPRPMLVEGTLVSADISGFTALSERLAALGNEGAEQLTDLLNRCFTEMIDACERRGGDVIKFGGDALLVLFTGGDHARMAASAMAVMHHIVSRAWSTDSAKRVSLGISQGAHSGQFGFSLVDMGHIELLVGGPAVSETVGCEGEAARGEILVSSAMADLLPADWLGRPTPSGARPLVRRRVPADEPGPPLPARTGVDGLDRYLARALAESVSAGVQGEHRQVVIAFVDIAETDTLYRHSGGLALHQACEQVGANVRSILQRHPIHLMASDAYVNGTKLILTAGAPVSTDADEDQMLLALHEFFEMENPLPMKAGVNRGHVFVGDLGGPTRRAYTVMGDAVNLAARLMQHASRGEIVVSRDVLDRSETTFSTTALEPFHVKGKSQPIHAAVLGRPSATEPDQPHIGHSEFVGREAELDRLDELAQSAARGEGSCVEVSGEPGIGKSRLVREVLARHPGLEVHRMRGGHYARNTPFFSARRLLRQLLDIDNEADAVASGLSLTRWVETNAPALSPWAPLIAIPLGAEVAATAEVDLLAEQFRRDRLLQVTADLVVHLVDSPVAFLAEDIHLFDTGSLDLYRQLARRSHEHPWFMIATHRGEPGYVDRQAHQLQLGSLTASEVATLAMSADEVFGDALSDQRRIDRLADRAGGNPLFLLELLSAARQAGTDDLPETVESLVTTRIDLLPAPDRLLLRDAAVGGGTFDSGLLAAAFGRPELAKAARWEGLSDFVVRDRPGVYRFRHAIYREVAYAGLSYRRRREAHSALGLTIEEREQANLTAVAPLLSDHFDRCRDRSRAWQYAVIGGDAARETYANIEAIHLYERALANADDTDDQDRSRVAEALGEVRRLNGEFSQAVIAFQDGRAHSRGRTEAEVRLLRKIGEVRASEGELSQALRWFTRAWRHLDDIASTETRLIEEAEIAIGRAGALHRQGRNGKCAESAEIAAAAAERAGVTVTRGRAYNMLEIAYRMLGRPEAAEYSDLALAMYADSGDLVGEANVLNNRGVQAHFVGDWADAIAHYDRSRFLRRQAGDVVGEAMAANNMGEILCLQNRFDEALELLESASVAWQAAGFTVGVAYVTANLGILAARSGDPEQGLELVDEAASAMVELGLTSLLLEARALRIECHLLAGATDQALAAATEMTTELSDSRVGDGQLRVQLAPLLGLAQLRSGARDLAGVTLSDGLTRATSSGDLYAQALCHLGAAELAGPTSDDGHSDRGDELLRQLGCVGRPPVAER